MAKAKGKKRTTRRRKKAKKRRKPVKRGLLGKMGAIVMGIGPPAIAGLEAVNNIQHVSKRFNLTGLSSVDYAFRRFLNNLTMGIIGAQAFSDDKNKRSSFTTKDGQRIELPIRSGVPAGSLWAVMGTGALMMFFDYAASYFTGNRAVNIPGTNIAATGSR